MTFSLFCASEARGCKPLDPTSNGFLTCTDDTVICTLTCYEGYRIAFGVASQEFVCNNNMWNGEMNFMTPHCRGKY